MPPQRPSSPRLRPRSWLGLALLMSTLACAGKAKETTSPPTAGPPTTAVPSGDEEELAARLERLAARLEQARVDNHIPGMAVAVVKGDELVFAQGFGYADLESKREVTPESVFAVGSTTKAFTTTLAAMQIDAGKLRWDDAVVDRVPELKLAPRPVQADGKPPQTTLRDLLSHRTGFTRMSVLWASGGLSRPDMLAQASHAEPIADFRKEFHYNNVNFAAVGEAAARTADTTWSAMLQERIFEPLGMGHTTVTVAGAQADPNLAQGYRWREESERHEALPMRDLEAIAPAGAINSTVLDMSQWLRLQLGRGVFEGERLVSEERIEEMWTPQIEIGAGLHYGLGWMVGAWRGHRMVEHGGNIDGYAAEVGMLPDDGIAFVLLTNTSSTPFQRGSLDLVFDSMIGELPRAGEEAGPTLDLSPYPGKYVADFGPFDDARFTVLAEGGSLHVDVPGQTKYELAPPNEQGRWAFAITDQIQVYFDLDETGKRAQVLHMLQGGLDLELPREGYAFPPEVEPAEVAELLGRYEEEGGKLKATVRVARGRLVADVDGQMAFDLRKPGEDGRWHLRARDSIAVSFRRDAKGKVDAMILHQDGKDVPLTRKAGAERPLPTVQALLAKSKAEAFEARLAKLGPIELRGKVRMPSSAVEGRFRLVIDAEHHHRMELDLGVHGRAIDTYDGKEAWSVSTMGPPTQAEGKYLRQTQLGGPLTVGDWSAGFDDARVEGWASRDGKELVEVVLRAKDLPPRRLLVDPKTGDVLGFDAVELAEGAGGIPTQGEVGEYRRELGLRLPHHLRSFNVHAGATIFEVETVTKAQGDPAELFGRASL